jgi:hypothetical protein
MSLEKLGRGLIVVVVAALTGCSIPHLQDNTIDVGASIGSIYTQQVLENLYRTAHDPHLTPSHFAFSKGTIQTSNSVTPGVSIPIGNQVKRGFSSGVFGVTEIDGPTKGITLQESEGWQQSWEINPENNPADLRGLRTIYQYVLGQTGSVEALRIINSLWLQSPPDHPPALGHEETITIAKRIIDNCGSGSGGCFWIKVAEECKEPPFWVKSATNANWICLGKYTSLYNKTLGREMMMQTSAFNADVLFDLVALSLQLQRANAIKDGG